MTCHQALMPTIDQDSRHKPMLGCIDCHSANPNSMAECGSDCFACHSIEKIEQANVGQHHVIRQCRDCHMKMKEELFSIPLNQGQSSQGPLKEFLLN